MKRKRKHVDALNHHHHHHQQQKPTSLGSVAQKKKRRKKKRKERAKTAKSSQTTTNIVQPEAKAEAETETETEAEAAAAAEAEAEVQIAAEDDTCKPKEMSSWSAPFPASLQQFFRFNGIAEPTKVQQQCWPPLLQGKNVLSVAPTGSGKTLGYLIPAAVKVLKVGHKNVPQVLVLVPTRELALQVLRVCTQISRVCKCFNAVALYGGVDRQAQADKLRSKEFLTDVVVGTPGRTKDLVESGVVDLSGVTYVVYDEYDKICSMGFLDDLKFISSRLEESKEKQVIFTSATSRKETEGALRSHGLLCADMKLLRIVVEREQADLNETISGRVSKSITQVVHVCAEHKKPRKLMKFLRKVKEEDKAEKRRHASKVLIFCNRIKTTTFLHGFLMKESVRSCCLNGSMKQKERETALRNFRAGKTQVMVATDVAARGIHLEGLPYVVNYTFPSTMDSYIHRVGRTGRRSDSGHAYSFFTMNFKPLAKPLIGLLEGCGQTVDPNLRKLVATGSEGEASSVP